MCCFCFSNERRNTILLTVEGSKFERRWLTICPAALNWRSTAELPAPRRYFHNLSCRRIIFPRL